MTTEQEREEQEREDPLDPELRQAYNSFLSDAGRRKMVRHGRAVVLGSDYISFKIGRPDEEEENLFKISIGNGSRLYGLAIDTEDEDQECVFEEVISIVTDKAQSNDPLLRRIPIFTGYVDWAVDNVNFNDLEPSEGQRHITQANICRGATNFPCM